MSEFIRSQNFKPVALADAMAQNNGFRPYLFAAPSAPESDMLVHEHAAPVPAPSAVPIDQDDDPFARGLAEGQRIAETAHQMERTQLLNLIASTKALQDEPSEELAQLIAETVERLVHQIVEAAPIDAEWLKNQAEIAAAMVAEADKARTLWVNPADAALLYDAELKLPVESDPAMMRGTVRIETSAGWIEHGRAVYLDELRSALGKEAMPA